MSKVTDTNKRIADEYNITYDREKSRWTVEEMDEFLEAFLVQELPVVSKKDCLLRTAHRTISSVLNMIHKLATNFENSAAQWYEPANRTNRSGTQLTDRDLVIVKLACGMKGQRRRAFEPAYLAKILARGEKEMDKWMRKWGGRRNRPTEQFFPDEEIDGPDKDVYLAIAQNVNRLSVLTVAHNAFQEEIDNA